MKVIFNKKDNLAPIKTWCMEPEEGALEQARNLASLPFLFKHVALMPDTHQGYGMPIGGVIACKNVVIPNAVGVDIGCLDRDTEFLTEKGWKKISEYSLGDSVLQFNSETEEASFTYPINYIVKDCDYFYHFKNTKGLDQMLSEEHKILVYKGYKKRGYTKTTMSPLDIRDMGDKLSRGYYGFKAAFDILNNDIGVTDDEIRLDVMVSADGCIKNNRGNENYIYLHLKKDRKIERAKKLLTDLSIKYKETIGVDTTSHIYFYANEKFNKDLSKYWAASKQQLKIVATESLLWDGHKGYRSFFSSTDKTNADIIQFAFAANNIRAGISSVPQKNNNWKDIYVVTPTKNNIVGYTSLVTKVKAVDGKKYCFTVSTGYFVARRNGRLFITGNCGMLAVKTSLKEISTEQLKRILGGSAENQGGIRSAIKVGMNHNKKACDDSEMPSLDYIQDNLQDSIVQQQYESAKKQLGTLGGGNHFIEIQKGDDGHIWFMLHSGSRNLGYQVANHYREVAKKLNATWHTTVDEKHDLAFLPLGTEEAFNYLAEMNYCLDFALFSREKMSNIIKGIFREEFHTIFFAEPINIHHNYARLEHHFGENVMIHRKGATSAKAGEMGIIPGSQGTASYIVRGKGNKDSFTSCSHGAGRQMSRKKAVENLDLEAEQKAMDAKGILHSVRHKCNLDEAPSAYKDIDVVMAEQCDLVDIVVRLEPLAVVKG